MLNENHWLALKLTQGQVPSPEPVITPGWAMLPCLPAEQAHLKHVASHYMWTYPNPNHGIFHFSEVSLMFGGVLILEYPHMKIQTWIHGIPVSSGRVALTQCHQSKLQRWRTWNHWTCALRFEGEKFQAARNIQLRANKHEFLLGSVPCGLMLDFVTPTKPGKERENTWGQEEGIVEDRKRKRENTWGRAKCNFTYQHPLVKNHWHRCFANKIVWHRQNILHWRTDSAVSQKSPRSFLGVELVSRMCLVIWAMWEATKDSHNAGWKLREGRTCYIILRNIEEYDT